MKCPHCYNDVGNDQPLLVRNLDDTFTAAIHCIYCGRVLTKKIQPKDFE